MIKLSQIRFIIAKCEMKFDKHGTPFLKCKGMTKGYEGNEEELVLERIGEDNKYYVTGVNYFTSVNIYGDVEELNKLVEEFQKKVDEANKKREETGKKVARVCKVVLSEDTYLRNYLVNGILLSCIYCFNYTFGLKLSKKKIPAIQGLAPKKRGRPKLSEKEKARREKERKSAKKTIKTSTRKERLKEYSDKNAQENETTLADKKLDKALEKVEKEQEKVSFNFDFLNELETFENNE